MTRSDSYQITYTKQLVALKVEDTALACLPTHKTRSKSNKQSSSWETNPTCQKIWGAQWSKCWKLNKIVNSKIRIWLCLYHQWEQDWERLTPIRFPFPPARRTTETLFSLTDSLLCKIVIKSSWPITWCFEAFDFEAGNWKFGIYDHLC